MPLNDLEFPKEWCQIEELNSSQNSTRNYGNCWELKECRLLHTILKQMDKQRELIKNWKFIYGSISTINKTIGANGWIKQNSYRTLISMKQFKILHSI